MPSLAVRADLARPSLIRHERAVSRSPGSTRLAADARWDPLLVCTAVYILTAVGRIHQLFPILNVLHPAILSGLSAIVLFMTDAREDRRLAHILSPPTKFLLALVGWMMLSMSTALVIGNSVDMVLNNVLKTAVMFLVVASAVRGVRDVERLAAVYFSAAAIYALVVIATFDLGADGRLGHLYYYDANDFATFAVTALPIGLYFLFSARRMPARLLTVAALGTLMLAFVRSGSRGGFVAVLAVAVFVVLRYSAIPLRRRLFATALVAVVVLATASGTYWTQMGTILSDTDYNRTDESGRLQIWQRGVGYMLHFPILGVGPSNFPTAEGTLSPQAARQEVGNGVRWNAAHNSYVQVGAELGVPGLVLFLGLLVSSFAALRLVIRRARDAGDRRRQDLAQALTASLIGFTVGAVFLSLAYTEMLYALLSLIVGLRKLPGDA